MKQNVALLLAVIGVEQSVRLHPLLIEAELREIFKILGKDAIRIKRERANSVWVREQTREMGAPPEKKLRGGRD